MADPQLYAPASAGSRGNTLAPPRQARRAGYMCWFGLAWIECLAEMPSDFIQFVSDRIEDDVSTQCAVLSCEDPASLRAIRLMFFESALSDYAAMSGGPTVFSPEILDRVEKADPQI